MPLRCKSCSGVKCDRENTDFFNMEVRYEESVDPETD